MLRDPVDKWLSNAFYWTREAKQSVGGGGPADAVRRRSAQRERRWLPDSRARRRPAGAPLRRRLTPWRHAHRRLVYSAGAAAPHQAARTLEVRSSEDDVSVCAPREERLLLPRPLRAFIHRRDTYTHARARARDPSSLARAHSAADVRAIEARLVTHSNEFSSFLPDGAADLARDFVVGDAADVEGAFVAFALARNWSLRSVHFEVGASAPLQGAAVGGEAANGTSPCSYGFVR